MGVLFPIVGSWYQAVNGDLFEVVAVDEQDMTIEIQYFDGSIEEFELESWQTMQIREAQPPEDWSGSLDIEREDYGVDLDEPGPVDDWESVLDQMEVADF